jgi:hypothetical protein
VEEGFVLDTGDSRVVKVLAVHEGSLLREVTFVVGVVVGSATLFVGGCLLRGHLTAGLATLACFVVRLIIIFGTAGQCAFTSVDAFVRVVNCVFSCELIKFALL